MSERTKEGKHSPFSQHYPVFFLLYYHISSFAHYRKYIFHILPPAIGSINLPIAVSKVTVVIKLSLPEKYLDPFISITLFMYTEMIGHEIKELFQ